jgi:hypothetical protein
MEVLMKKQPDLSFDVIGFCERCGREIDALETLCESCHDENFVKRRDPDGPVTLADLKRLDMAKTR